ncbi:MAG: hypothetical protein ABJC13_13005 [Acidobacteriota bacterium]
MIRRKLPLAIVFSSLVLLVAAAQPAAAFPFGPEQPGRGLWAEAREWVDGFLRTIGLGATERDDSKAIFSNVGSILDPDGTPSAAHNGAGNVPVNETH